MISVAIMAHPKREQWAGPLADAIDADVTVIWDRCNDRWDTGRRSLLAHHPDATHHLVIQDDAVVCRDLIAGLQQAVAYSQHRPVGLYIGQVRPSKTKVERAVREADRQQTSWVAMQGPWWGVGILLPTADIEDVVAFGDTRDDLDNYDRKIARYYASRNVRCWYTHPSLVDHRHGIDEAHRPVNPSLIPGRTGIHRQAHRFVGEDVSALDIDWSATPDDNMPEDVGFVGDDGDVRWVRRGSADERRLRGDRKWRRVDVAHTAFRSQSTGQVREVPAGTTAEARFDQRSGWIREEPPMQRLYNPQSGTVDTFTDGAAKVRRRNGWTDPPDEHPEPEPDPETPADPFRLDPPHPSLD